MSAKSLKSAKIFLSVLSLSIIGFSALNAETLDVSLSKDASNLLLKPEQRLLIVTQRFSKLEEYRSAIPINEWMKGLEDLRGRADFRVEKALAGEAAPHLVSLYATDSSSESIEKALSSNALVTDQIPRLDHLNIIEVTNKNYCDLSLDANKIYTLAELRLKPDGERYYQKYLQMTQVARDRLGAKVVFKGQVRSLRGLSASAKTDLVVLVEWPADSKPSDYPEQPEFLKAFSEFEKGVEDIQWYRLKAANSAQTLNLTRG